MRVPRAAAPALPLLLMLSIIYMQLLCAATRTHFVMGVCCVRVRYAVHAFSHASTLPVAAVPAVSGVQ